MDSNVKVKLLNDLKLNKESIKLKYQKTINAIDDLKKIYEELYDYLNKPSDITLEDIDKIGNLLNLVDEKIKDLK